MSQHKKQIWRRFREAVFARDHHRCACCGFESSPERAESELDAHHITDRTEMPSGGYVPENGISLCEACHWKAEAFHRGEPIPQGYSPEELYRRIGSSYEVAVAASERLAAD